MRAVNWARRATAGRRAVGSENGTSFPRSADSFTEWSSLRQSSLASKQLTSSWRTSSAILQRFCLSPTSLNAHFTRCIFRPRTPYKAKSQGRKSPRKPRNILRVTTNRTITDVIIYKSTKDLPFSFQRSILVVFSWAPRRAQTSRTTFHGKLLSAINDVTNRRTAADKQRLRFLFRFHFYMPLAPAAPLRQNQRVSGIIYESAYLTRDTYRINLFWICAVHVYAHAFISGSSAAMASLFWASSWEIF